MGTRQIDHIDIVADTRAVGGIVVVTKDTQALADTRRRLGDVGNKVLGHTTRQLTDQCRGVRTEGVEITQRNTVQFALRRSDRIAQNIFAHLLGVAIGRGGGLAGRLLGHGQHVRLAINRCRRREDDIRAIIFTGQLQQIDEREDIVVIVLQRFLDRFTHRLRGCEVDHGIEAVLAEHLLEGLAVAAIDLLEGYLHARNTAHTLDCQLIRVRQIIHQHHVVTRLDEFDSRMRADISGTARNQNATFHHSSKKVF